MRLSRTDLLPLLTIMAGGVLGASLSLGLLGRSLAVDVPAPTAEALRWNAEWKMAVERSHERARERIEAGQPLSPSERLEAEIELLNDRIEEQQRLLERDQEELLRRDIEEDLNAVEFRLREELQEDGWDVTTQPPVFWLPEIQQRPSVSVDCADNGVVVWFFLSEEGQVLDRRVCP